MFKITIAVCCYNSEKLIEPTLQALLNQKFQQNIAWDILIIDNNSTDQTVSIASDILEKSNIPFKVFNEKQQGAGFARYAALENATGDIISFVDDDVRVAEDWVQVIYHTFSEQPDLAACGGTNQAGFEAELPSWFDNFAYAYAVGPQHPRKSREVGYLWGAGLTLRKSAWDSAKQALPNQHFFCSGRKKDQIAGSGEDSEISYLLLLKNLKLLHVPELQLKHYLPPKRLTWDYLVQLHKGFGASDAVLLAYQRFLNPNNILVKNWFFALFSTFLHILYLHLPLPHYKGIYSKKNSEWYLVRTLLITRMRYLLLNYQLYSKVVKALNDSL